MSLTLYYNDLVYAPKMQEESGQSGPLQRKEVTITQNGITTVNPDQNYDGLSQVQITTQVNLPLQEKQVEVPLGSIYEIFPDIAYYGLSKVTVTTPSLNLQRLNKLITGSGIFIFEPDYPYDGFSKAYLVVQLPQINLETKDVYITSNGTTTYTPSSGFDGIGTFNLTVNVSSSGGGSSGSMQPRLIFGIYAMTYSPQWSGYHVKCFYRTYQINHTNTWNHYNYPHDEWVLTKTAIGIKGTVTWNYHTPYPSYTYSFIDFIPPSTTPDYNLYTEMEYKTNLSAGEHCIDFLINDLKTYYDSEVELTKHYDSEIDGINYDYCTLDITICLYYCHTTNASIYPDHNSSRISIQYSNPYHYWPFVYETHVQSIYDYAMFYKADLY